MSAPEARVELGGLELDSLRSEEVVRRVIADLDRGRGGWLATPNLDQLRQAAANPALRELLSASDLAVADGMPLIWASRLQGEGLPERVAGSDLVWTLSAAAARAGMRLQLVGGAGDAGRRAGRIFAARSPGLDVAEHLPLPMGFDATDPSSVDAVREALSERRPDLVFVALGFPKQDQLISALRPSLPGTWFMGVGISLSFVAGDVSRAPAWLAALGLEWLHRLAQEPGRLWRRYLIHDLPFCARLLAGALVRRTRGIPR